jgi:hypothetical protein
MNIPVPSLSPLVTPLAILAAQGGVVAGQGNLPELGVTVGRTVVVLLLYGALLVLIYALGGRWRKEERRTFLFVAAAWAISVFVGNYLLYLAGVMSFLPWINNFLHTFVWIGACLATLFLGVRRTQPLWIQCLLFALLSLIVKAAEQRVLGSWEHTHFLFLFAGNVAYVVGWSLADGLYPILTRWALLGAARFIPGIIPR